MSDQAGDTSARFDVGVDRLAADGLTGAGVVVAQLDSGVNAGIPHLAGRVAEQIEMARDGTAVIAPAGLEGADHGTYTAGLIVGRRTGGLREGVAPGAVLHAVTVIEAGNTVARMVAGLDWALGAGARVVCMAAGVKPPGRVLAVVAGLLAERGVVVVCPIGNGGAGSYVMPGGGASVLSVGASDGGRVAPFSGSRNRPDGVCAAPLVVAPGVGVVGATSSGGIMSESGTSASAALVAGVVALMLEAVPSASSTDVVAALAASSLPFPSGQEHRCVAGAVDPFGAVEAVRRGPTFAAGNIVPVAPPGGLDRRMLEIARRSGRSVGLSAVVAGRHPDEVRRALAAHCIEPTALFDHVPAAIVRSPLGSLCELAADQRVLAVDSAHVDRSGRR